MVSSGDREIHSGGLGTASKEENAPILCGRFARRDFQGMTSRQGVYAAFIPARIRFRASPCFFSASASCGRICMNCSRQVSLPHVKGVRETVPGRFPDSSRSSPSVTIARCMSASKGRPHGLPSGKSVNTNRGTPQCSTMSSADPRMTVAMPASSKCLAARLTVWWHTGHKGTSIARSAPSSRQRRSSSGASTVRVRRWLYSVGRQ